MNIQITRTEEHLNKENSSDRLLWFFMSSSEAQNSALVGGFL